MTDAVPHTKKKNSQTFVKPKEAKVVQSANTKELYKQNGDSVSIPTFEKLLVEQPLSIQVSNLLAFNDASPAKMALLKEHLIMQKEIQELSRKLGLNMISEDNIDLYREVADWIGTKYRRGGMSRSSVDCSGFTNIIYKNVFSTQLPRVSTEIANKVKEAVAKEDLQPGDLVFFSTFGKRYINHVGVYIGEGLFVHASIKKGVTVSSLSEGYYSKAWRKGGRM